MARPISRDPSAVHPMEIQYDLAGSDIIADLLMKYTPYPAGFGIHRKRFHGDVSALGKAPAVSFDNPKQKCAASGIIQALKIT